MRRKIIRSLFLGGLLVMILSFFVVTPLLIYINHSSSQRKIFSQLETNIDHIEPIAQMSLSFRTSKMDKFFRESMNQLAYFTGSNILFTDIDGNVIWADGIESQELLHKYSGKAVRILKLSRGTVRSSGLLDGLYGEKTVTVGKYLKNDMGKEAGIVFCTGKAPTVSAVYRYVFMEILTIELITLSFVALFMLFFSRSVTVPLKRINNTLKEFTKGNFDARVAYSRDNELGELSANINQMADSIGALEKMRQDFVSDISHELRTPMTTISGFIEGVLDGTIPDSDREKYLGIALSESKRLSKLTNDLLNLSRIDDQVKNLSLSDFDMDEIAKIALINFEDIITKKGINVEFELEGDKFIVRADKDKYIQVLTNLFHNAVKFTPENGNITIKLKKEDQKCICSVKNTGYGIEPDKLRFIWERFYKADNSRSTDKSGVGIGLYIVKKIIDAHDETISVQSITNKFTEFSFTVQLV